MVQQVQKKLWARIENALSSGLYKVLGSEIRCIVIYNRHSKLMLSTDGVAYWSANKLSPVYQPEFITEKVKEIVYA
jgi:hypothetical protein